MYGMAFFTLSVMWVQGNPSIADTIGNQHNVPYSEVSLTQGLPVYIFDRCGSVWSGCLAQLRFQSFPLLYGGEKGSASLMSSC